jgi:hypothetical protein
MVIKIKGRKMKLFYDGSADAVTLSSFEGKGRSGAGVTLSLSKGCSVGNKGKIM